MFTWPHSAQRRQRANSLLSSRGSCSGWPGHPPLPLKDGILDRIFFPSFWQVAYTPSAPVEWFAVSKRVAGCWNMNWKAELWFSTHPGNVMQCHPRPLYGGPCPVSHTCLWWGHVSCCVRKRHIVYALTHGGGGGLIKLLSGIRCRAVVTGSREGEKGDGGHQLGTKPQLGRGSHSILQ